MRLAEITLTVELSEEINDKDGEAELFDDLKHTIETYSNNVAQVRAMEVKPITQAQFESCTD